MCAAQWSRSGAELNLKAESELNAKRRRSAKIREGFELGSRAKVSAKLRRADSICSQRALRAEVAAAPKARYLAMPNDSD